MPGDTGTAVLQLSGFEVCCFLLCRFSEQSDGFDAQQRVRLSPLRGGPSPAVPCRLRGGSGISSDVAESCTPVKERSCMLTS